MELGPFNKKQELIVDRIGQDESDAHLVLSHVLDLRFVYSVVFITSSMCRRLVTHPASTLFTFPADCTWQRLNFS